MQESEANGLGNIHLIFCGQNGILAENITNKQESIYNHNLKTVCNFVTVNAYGHGYACQDYTDKGKKKIYKFQKEMSL